MVQMHCSPWRLHFGEAEALRVKVASLLFLQFCPAKISWNNSVRNESVDRVGKFRNPSKKPDLQKGEKAYEQQAQASSAPAWRGRRRPARGQLHAPLPRCRSHDWDIDHETRVNFDMDQFPRTQNVCNTLVAIFAHGDECGFPV
jgi:hypothetical protein